MKTDSRAAVILLALDALQFADLVSDEWDADKQIRHLREQIALARKHLESEPAESLAAHDAEVIERALSDDKVREAMQLIWNDHTSDTGCFPDDFSIKSDDLLYFTAGHYFADRVASQLRQQAQEAGL